jgi:hypothetical protein
MNSAAAVNLTETKNMIGQHRDWSAARGGAGKLWQPRRLLSLAALALASSLSAPAGASNTVCTTSSVPCTEGVVVNAPGGGTTPLTGNVDRMISYGHQQHSWQTPDGALHLIVNVGLATTTTPNASLILYTSTDNGLTFTPEATLPNSGNFSTSDGLLTTLSSSGDSYLTIAYSGNDVNNALEGGSIFYTILKYNPSAHTWAVVGTNTKVYDAAANSATYVALNPAIAIDPQNRIWCSYVRETRVNYGSVPPFPASTIRMSVGTASSPVAQPTWQDTGLSFGFTDSTTSNVERSARPMPLTNGIGLLYTVHQNFFWATRQSNWSVTHKWTAPISILTSSPPYDSNPYESHFSVVEDSAEDIHLTTVDHQRVLYFQYSAAAQRWGQPKVVAPGTNQDGSSTLATYPKISLVNGNLLEIFINDAEIVRVYQSSDNGDSFAFAYELAHDNVTSLGDPNSGADGFQNPRVETPSLWTSSASPAVEPVMQQYLNGPSGVVPTQSLTDTLQQLMNFQLSLVH